MKQPSKKVHVKPGGPDDRLRILDVEASINATPAIAKAAAQRQAVLEAGDAVEFWMKNARRPEGGTGLKQTELARLLGVSQARISQLVNAESGHGPSYALLRRICLACGFSWPQGLVEALQINGPTEDQPEQTQLRRPDLTSNPDRQMKLARLREIIEARNIKSKAKVPAMEARPAGKAQTTFEAALHNLFYGQHGDTTRSDEFAIIRVDEYGQFDLDHMALIDTKGEDT